MCILDPAEIVAEAARLVIRMTNFNFLEILELAICTSDQLVSEPSLLVRAWNRMGIPRFRREGVVDLSKYVCMIFHRGRD